ncbi:hypothetical protein MMC27_008611 [Xylographa pallens]|nr:hypothetical protein [Xylographa pallens]
MNPSMMQHIQHFYILDPGPPPAGGDEDFGPCLLAAFTVLLMSPHHGDRATACTYKLPRNRNDDSRMLLALVITKAVFGPYISNPFASRSQDISTTASIRACELIPPTLKHLAAIQYAELESQLAKLPGRECGPVLGALRVEC